MMSDLVKLCGDECDGCRCHLSPPCNHCVDHLMERMTVRKGSDGNWQYGCPICDIPECLWLSWSIAMGAALRHMENHIVAVRGIRALT